MIEWFKKVHDRRSKRKGVSMKSKRSFIAVIITLLLLPSMCGAAIRLPELRDIHGHWSESYITECTERGIASGFSDGTFRPTEPVTRAQFI
jgi:hypothetical protein